MFESKIVGDLLKLLNINTIIYGLVISSTCVNYAAVNLRIHVNFY